MPATEHKNLFRILFPLAFACGLTAQEPIDTVYQAATALGNGDAGGFASSFDPSTPGLARIRADAGELVSQADAQSTIRAAGESGDTSSRTLLLDWGLRITDKDTTGGRTERDARVTCRLALRKGQWRIVQFEPRDFFRPPHTSGAWNVLESAATALNSGNAAEFLTFFVKSMPGYNRLRAGAVTLVAEGEIQSSIELVSNEGTDTVRTLEVDWTLQIVSEDTRMQRAAREQRVKCRLELQGSRWHIIAIDPLDFFSPILLGNNFPYKRKSGTVLLDGEFEGRSPLRGNLADRSADRAQA
jgi:hypothetical protein